VSREAEHRSRPPAPHSIAHRGSMHVAADAPPAARRRRQVSQKAAHRHARDAAAAGKASFGWAWLLDERPEERAHGTLRDGRARGHAAGRAGAPRLCAQHDRGRVRAAARSVPS